MDGVCQPRVLRAPEHSGRGARARARTCERARAPSRATKSETPCRLDSCLR